MRVLVAAFLILFAALPAWATELSWTGQRKTSWHDGCARMELQQHCSRSSSCWPWNGQSFMGRFEVGEWQTGGRVQADAGIDR